MDNARRKLRVCLICVVMAAVVIGLIYYFNDMRSQGKINEGTLVENCVLKKGVFHGGIVEPDGLIESMCENGVQESRA
ncbi:MAG: hypothetical protein HFG82_09410 [Dorea sp.]|jgi:hypothetical protein|nr:hypothetical protein [Dorea sp.]